MNNEDRKKLMAKYLAGESNLEEEQDLRTSDQDNGEGLDLWFKYISLQKKEVPEGLNEELWAASSLNKNRVSQLMIPIISVAASIMLLLFTFSIFNKPNTQNLEEKQRLWEEAMLMVEEAELNESKDILYSDDLITISLKSN